MFLTKCLGHFFGPIRMLHFIMLLIRLEVIVELSEVIGELSLKLSTMISSIVLSQGSENMK